MKKTCIIIAGPTAIGKTALAIKLASHFNTSIISADSRQCYRELDIGVARPSADELNTVPHFFIASHSIQQTLSAADFEEYAMQAANSIFKKNDVCVLVGGTGLYIRAFCEGMDPIPPIDAATREQIIASYKEKGLGWLQQELQQADPEYFAQAAQQNPQRLMRALEVKLGTGSSILRFQQQVKKERDFNIIRYALQLPREQLYERINQRVDNMMQQGLLQEVAGLQAYQSLNALQTVGYRELFQFLDGSLSLAQAIELVKQHTRQYAKRQLTWFKKDPGFSWVDVQDMPAAFATILDDCTKKMLR